MKYTFHCCQPHAKCPTLTGWYLVLRPDDLETLIKIHRGVCVLYFLQKSPLYYNPIKLAALWLASIENYLVAGETVLVNSSGGIMPFNGTIILETVESNDLHWNDRYDDEEITISRWPQGKHWYLVSNKERVFIPAKYSSYTEARTEALRYAPHDRLHLKERTGLCRRSNNMKYNVAEPI